MPQSGKKTASAGPARDLEGRMKKSSRNPGAKVKVRDLAPRKNPKGGARKKATKKKT